MLPFALGAVVGAIAVTAIAESRIGKAFSKKGAKIIDTLEDRVSSLAQTVVENNDLCEKLKSGYETVSSKVNELAEYCQAKGKEVVQKVKAEVKAEAKAKIESKSSKTKEDEKAEREAERREYKRKYYAQKRKEAREAKEHEAKAAQAKSAKTKTPATKKKK